MRTQLPQARQQLNAHPGLLLQRYVAHPADGSERWQRAKSDIQDAARTAMPCELYKAAFDRWQNSLPELTATNILQTVGRLIVGLGSENVLETGIRLHHAYGMPILPGSALKGLAAHYCDQVWGQSDRRFKKPTQEEDKAYRKWLAGLGPKPEDNYHRLLFGTTDDSGCVVFHDGWFVPDSEKEPLKLDVMTPHHPKWLDGSVPPTDFDSPTPVPFLSVSGTFRIAVSWHGPEHPQAKCWTERASQLLRDALHNWGVGGKTTSGYGRLADPKDLAVPTASQPGITTAASPAMAPSGAVRVRFLGSHDKLKNAFWVQEEGKKRGLLKYGAPPTPLPDVDSEIEVYRTNNNPNSPEYRWDVPPSSSGPGKPGGERPRRRR
jgi:CRISPR type III-B/RAMP module RAMP protein Cmr6